MATPIANIDLPVADNKTEIGLKSINEPLEILFRSENVRD
jgi:hypothetical protein